MFNVTISKAINVSSEKSWDVLKDFQNIHYFNPYVKSVDLKTDFNGGIDSKRICHMIDGSELHERVIKWENHNKYQVQIENNLGPIYDCKTTIEIEKISDSQSKMNIMLNYKVKYGIIGKLMNRFYITKRMNKDFIHLINGMELHAKTGTQVSLKELRKHNYIS